MTIQKRLIFFLACLCMFISPAFTQERPSGWPWHAVSIGFPDGSIADLQRAHRYLGVKVVRLDIEPRWYAKRKSISANLALAASLNWLNIMLDECMRLKMGAVVHIGVFPLSPQDHTAMTSRLFWENQKNIQEIEKVTHILVQNLNHRGGELLAYQIISEPAILVPFGAAKQPSQWNRLQQHIISTIREKDKDRWIIVNPGRGGGPGSYLFDLPPRGYRIMWGIHVYIPHAFTHQGIHGRKRGLTYPDKDQHPALNVQLLKKSLQALRVAEQRYAVPVWVGEFSAVRWADGGEEYLKDLVSLFNKYGWGWDYFSFSGYHGWNPDYDNMFSNDFPLSWKPHFVGLTSPRWKTLNYIFKTDVNKK